MPNFSAFNFENARGFVKTLTTLSPYVQNYSILSFIRILVQLIRTRSMHNIAVRYIIVSAK